MRRSLFFLFILAGSVLGTTSRNASAMWPSIEEVARRAQDRAPALAEARGQMGAAQATMAGARLSAFQNPYVETFVDTSKLTKDVTVTTNFWMPLELAGQRGARIAEAEQYIKLRSRNFTEARARALGESITAYGDLMVLSARLEQAKQQEADARAEVEFFSGKLAAADTTLYEKSTAEAELGRWVQQRVDIEVQLVAARSRLAILLGATSIETPPPAANLQPPQLRIPFAEAQAPDVARRSPIIASLVAESEYWNANKERAVAERHLPVNFIGTIGRGDGGEFRYGGGLSWTFPLIQRNQGPIAKAEAERTRVVTVRETIERTLESRLLSLYEMMKVTDGAVRAVDTNAIPAALRVVDAATQLWKAGKTEALRVFMARRDLAAARARRLDLVAAGFRTYGELATLRGELP